VGRENGLSYGSFMVSNLSNIARIVGMNGSPIAKQAHGGIFTGVRKNHKPNR
jgi:hypothetical protein